MPKKDRVNPELEVEAVKQAIIGLEAKGKDAAYEKSLLRAWTKVEGFEELATKALADLRKYHQKPQD